MPTSSTVFTGTSSYSSDLQAVLQRAIAIQSLGLTSLNTAKARIGGQTTAVGALDSVVSKLQAAVSALHDSTGVAALSTSLSTAGVVQPSLAAGALPGNYSIEVTNLGASTSTLSSNGLIAVSDPAAQNIAAGTAFTLTINGVDTSITASASNLNSLAAAINAQPSLNVQASIVNIGSSGTPDYRLALQSTKLGPVTIQLKSGSSALLDTLSTGTLASYKVGGLSTVLTSDSRNVTLSPGLTITLLQQSQTGVPTVITVSRSNSAVTNALAAFATAYNGVVSEMDKNRGTANGSLTGDSLLSTISQTLLGMFSYSNGAAAASDLTSLGFSFDKNGVLSFDPAAFNQAVAGNTGALDSFLGDSTSGFIKAASDALATLEDPSSGAVKNRLSSLAAQSTDEDARIAAEQARIDQFTTDMTARISAADSLIASLQQQVTFVSGLFAAQTAANNALNR